MTTHRAPDPAVLDKLANTAVREQLPPVESHRSRRRSILSALFVVGVVLVGLFAAYGLLTRSTINPLQDDVRSLGAQAATNADAANRLEDQLRQNGIQPTVTPSALPGPQGAQGSPGAVGADGPAPSFDQIQLAVNSYCSLQSCTPVITTDQVSSALRSYCDANGQCRGPQGNAGGSGAPGANGAAGSSGSDGASGTDGAAGAQGPGPTDDQVAAAVASYCVTNGCTGPQGAIGPAGPAPGAIVILVPAPTLLDPNATRTETCTPDESSPPVYRCQ